MADRWQPRNPTRRARAQARLWAWLIQPHRPWPRLPGSRGQGHQPLNRRSPIA